MKSKHVFINESEVYPEMRVHLVMVGISQREKRQADRILTCAAHCHDIYFKKYDCDVCDFIHRLAEQIYDYLGPRDAWDKFYSRNVKISSLSEIIKSLPILPRKNPKLLTNA